MAERPKKFLCGVIEGMGKTNSAALDICCRIIAFSCHNVYYRFLWQTVDV